MKRYHELTAVTQTENCIASLTENAAAITRNDSNCKYSTVVNFPNKHCHMNAKKIIVILCPKKLNLLFFEYFCQKLTDFDDFWHVKS